MLSSSYDPAVKKETKEAEPIIPVEVTKTAEKIINKTK